MRTNPENPSSHIVEEELQALKAAAIRATADADAAFYKDYLAEDAIGVTPMGIFNKSQILDAMAGGQAFKSSKIENSRAKALGPDAGLVTYEATFGRPGAEARSLFVSTLYERRNGKWKGVFYQQTPLPAA
jgi:hypothetical protein